MHVTVACPGPIDVGEEATSTRMVYGADGLMQQKNTSKSKKRVPVKVAAALIAKAAYYKLDECWISNHPVLLMGYIMQYMPSIAMKILKRIGPGRVRQFQDGSGTGYDLGGMLAGNKGD